MANLITIIGAVGTISLIPASICIGYSLTPNSNVQLEMEKEISEDKEKEEIVEEAEEIPITKPKEISPTTSQPQHNAVTYPQRKKPASNQNDLIGSVQSGSVGSKFKDYLIGTRDDSLGNKKINIWSEFYKDTKHKGSLTIHFTPKKSEQLTKELLQNKCRLAYVKKRGNIFTKKHETIMNEGYGDTVYSLCGQEKQMPQGGGQGSLT